MTRARKFRRVFFGDPYSLPKLQTGLSQQGYAAKCGKIADHVVHSAFSHYLSHGQKRNTAAYVTARLLRALGIGGNFFRRARCRPKPILDAHG
jgi:hypothetical protein